MWEGDRQTTNDHSTKLEPLDFENSASFMKPVKVITKIFVSSEVYFSLSSINVTSLASKSFETVMIIKRKQAYYITFLKITGGGVG